MLYRIRPETETLNTELRLWKVKKIPRGKSQSDKRKKPDSYLRWWVASLGGRCFHGDPPTKLVSLRSYKRGRGADPCRAGLAPRWMWRPRLAQNPRLRARPLHTREVSTGLRGGWSHRGRRWLHGGGAGVGLCIPLRGTGARRGVCRKGLQESLLFLLFFRKEGVRNFFFFLDGDLPGDPSLPASSAAGEAASSATWAGAGSGLATGGDLEGDPEGLGGPPASPSPSSSSQVSMP